MGVYVRKICAMSSFLMLMACAASEMSVTHRAAEDKLRISDVEAEALIQRMAEGENVSSKCRKCRLFFSHEGIVDSANQRFPFISSVTTDSEALLLRIENGETVRLPFTSFEGVHVIHRTWLTIDYLGVKIRPDQVIWLQASLVDGPSNPNRPRAAALADALLSLRIGRADEPRAEEKFSQALTYYSAVSPKPQPTEEMRRYAVQAQLMIREKRFNEAAQIYAKALDIAPWWPEARYNRALVLGELKRYRLAIREMERFLKLEPNTSARRAIQDKIYEWEALAKGHAR